MFVVQEPEGQAAGSRSRRSKLGAPAVHTKEGDLDTLTVVAAVKEKLSSRSKKPRRREQRHADLLGKEVDVPGDVFGMDPAERCRATVLEPDRYRKDAVVVKMLSKDWHSSGLRRYFFPAVDVRR